jgi:hypothetical protein
MTEPSLEEISGQAVPEDAGAAAGQVVRAA